jgi:hypothetical protein
MIAMIAITIINSIRVKPFRWLRDMFIRLLGEQGMRRLAPVARSPREG